MFDGYFRQLFNANNLLHGSIGNYECKTFRCLLFAYRCLADTGRAEPNADGGMTFVLDAKQLEGRMFVEPIDGGLMTMLQWRYNPTLLTHYFSATFRPFCAVLSPFFRGCRLPGAKTERTGEIWGRNGRETAVT